MFLKILNLRLKMNKILLIILVYFGFQNNNILFGQTHSSKNYEEYTYETSRNGFGYLITKINFPDYLNYLSFSQKGFLYTYQYYQSEIAAINFTNNFRMRFITEGNFNIGGGFSENFLNPNFQSEIYNNYLKMYSAKIDFYSFDVAPEFTYVFDNGLSLTAKLGMNIFTVGTDIAFPDGGDLSEDFLLVANLVPLIIKPQLLIDFGRSVLGFGFLIHPKNFVEYKFVPKYLFDDKDNGVVFNDNFFMNYVFQILFYY